MRRPWAQRRSVWVVVSLAAHAAFLAALVLSVRPERLPSTQPFEVALVRPPPVLEASKPHQYPGGARRQAHAPTSPPVRNRSPVLPSPAQREPVVDPSGAPPGDELLGRIADALAGRAGCDPTGLRRLSPETQDECEERESAAARAAARLPSPMERDGALESYRARRQVRFKDPGRLAHDALPDLVMVGVAIPTGSPPKAVEAIAPSSLRGDDDALRPKPRQD